MMQPKKSVGPNINYPKYISLNRVDYFILETTIFQYTCGKINLLLVTGSSPDEVEFFHPSSRTMVLGSTQPLTEMSTRNLPGG
jgi:hypothetical protein